MKLAHLAAGDADDIFVEQTLHVEHLIEPLPQAGNGFGNLLQELPHSRRVLVDVVLVPALLQIIGTVAFAIAVAKGDVLDVVGNSEQLGKSIGSDSKDKKINYMSLYGEEYCLALIEKLTCNAKDAVRQSFSDTSIVFDLADSLADRKN